MTSTSGPTLEQIEAAWSLIDADGPCCAFYRLGTTWQERCVVMLNLSDTFAYASADGEVIPWDEIVAFASVYREYNASGDAAGYCIDWAVKRRGKMPVVDESLVELKTFRGKYQPITHGDKE